jgi:hypothetical protein
MLVAVIRRSRSFPLLPFPFKGGGEKRRGH